MDEVLTKVVVDCGTYGSPSQEHIDNLKEEAVESLEKGDLTTAAKIMEQVKESQVLYDRPVETVVELTEEELAQHAEDQKEGEKNAIVMARAERNGLLAASDWTQLEDSPVKGDTAWLTYRQALRDLDFTDPSSIKWPELPGSD
jgi:hypothetical protein